MTINLSRHYPCLLNLNVFVFFLKVNANKVVSIDNLLVVDGTEEGLLCRVSKQPVSVSIDATGLQFYTGVRIFISYNGYILLSRKIMRI